MNFSSCSTKANHGGVRGKIPDKFIEDPDAFCAGDSNLSDDDDDDDDDDEFNCSAAAGDNLNEKGKTGKVSC